MNLKIELKGDSGVVVNNWPDLLHKRLRVLFSSKEHCDLELVFADEETIKVHSLVLNACTDFFRVQLHKQRRSPLREDREALAMGRLVMPRAVEVGAARALVGFAYTGKLDAETPAELTKLLKTARTLGMMGAVISLDRLYQRLQINKKTAESQRDKSKESDNAKSKETASKGEDAPMTITRASQRQPVTKKVNPRSIPTTKHAHPPKQLKASDVFQKYAGVSRLEDSSSMFDEETRAKIVELALTNENVQRFDGTPVRIRLKQKVDAFHLKQVSVTVTSLRDEKGRKTFQLVREKDQSADVAAGGPWDCKTCLKKEGKKELPLKFLSYRDCRLHHEKVHGQKFNPKICDHCGLTFGKRLVLAQHKYVKHNIKPPEDLVFSKCQECDHLALNKVCLNRHMEKVHGKEGVKSYEQVNDRAPVKRKGSKSSSKPSKVSRVEEEEESVEFDEDEPPTPEEEEEEEKSSDDDPDSEASNDNRDEAGNGTDGSDDDDNDDDDDDEESETETNDVGTTTSDLDMPDPPAQPTVAHAPSRIASCPPLPAAMPTPWQPMAAPTPVFAADPCSSSSNVAPAPAVATALPGFQCSFAAEHGAVNAGAINTGVPVLPPGMAGPYANAGEPGILMNIAVPEDFDGYNSGVFHPQSYFVLPPQQQHNFHPHICQQQQQLHQADGFMIPQHQSHQQQQHQSFMAVDQMIPQQQQQQQQQPWMNDLLGNQQQQQSLQQQPQQQHQEQPLPQQQQQQHLMPEQGNFSDQQ